MRHNSATPDLLPMLADALAAARASPTPATGRPMNPQSMLAGACPGWSFAREYQRLAWIRMMNDPKRITLAITGRAEWYWDTCAPGVLIDEADRLIEETPHLTTIHRATLQAAREALEDIRTRWDDVYFGEWLMATRRHDAAVRAGASPRAAIHAAIHGADPVSAGQVVNDALQGPGRRQGARGMINTYHAYPVATHKRRDPLDVDDAR